VDFNDLYDTHAMDVYKYIYALCRNKHMAEDITGDTFLSAIQSIHKFKGDCTIRVWLCQIAKNKYFNAAKRNKFTTPMPDDLPEGEHFTIRLHDKTRAFEIHKVLHTLNEPYKEVFSLRVFSELSFAEIAELFGKSESWARVTFHRAKSKIIAKTDESPRD